MVGAGVRGRRCGCSSASRPTWSARWRSSPIVFLGAFERMRVGARRVPQLRAWLACCVPLRRTKADPVSSMRRLLIPIAALLAAARRPGRRAAPPRLGISDQQAGTFTNPLFAPLKLKVARYITPYDVMDEPGREGRARRLDRRRASAAHQKILISFEHSHRSNRGPSRRRRSPRTRRRSRRSRRRIRRQGHLAVERGQRLPGARDGSMQGQPTKICKLTTGPKLAAQYYSAARKVFKGRRDRRPRHPRRAERRRRRSVPAQVPALRLAGPEDHRASTTTPTPTASRPRAPSACCRPSAGKVWLTETGGS